MDNKKMDKNKEIEDDRDFGQRVSDAISIDNFRNQILKNAYGNTDTFIAGLDPRVMIFWYIFFAIVPWFARDPIILIGMFSFLVLTTIAARVAPIVLIVFVIGVFSETFILGIVTLFFGGDGSAFIPLIKFTLKVATVSLASVTTFSGMDPDKLATGLIWFGIPESFSFSVSYAYRILPTLLEELQNILLSLRLRGIAPETDSFKGKIKNIVYHLKNVMSAFYPLLLNTAKRSRTMVEALDLRGYRYAQKDKKAKELKLSKLSVSLDDLLFVIITILWISVSLLVSSIVNR